MTLHTATHYVNICTCNQIFLIFWFELVLYLLNISIIGWYSLFPKFWHWFHSNRSRN